MCILGWFKYGVHPRCQILHRKQSIGSQDYRMPPMKKEDLTAQQAGWSTTYGGDKFEAELETVMLIR